MKKILALQITALILASGTLGGMFAFTDVYDEVHSRIVSVTCLSCIKLDPVISLDFTFDTANGEDHPKFIMDYLEKGPVFLAFRTDVCVYCDDMEPLIMQIFNLEFEKEDVFAETVDFNGTDFTFIHINNDHATGDFKGLQAFYDIDGDNAVPMFTTITLGYYHGFIKPYYNTVYGILEPDYTDEQRIQLLTNIIGNGIELYEENRPGFIL